jgi:hypothetical protein
MIVIISVLQVLIGGGTCAPVAGGWDHTQIKCSLPPGQGLHQVVKVIVDAQTSNELEFNYDPPVWF